MVEVEAMVEVEENQITITTMTTTRRRNKRRHVLQLFLYQPVNVQH